MRLNNGGTSVVVVHGHQFCLIQYGRHKTKSLHCEMKSLHVFSKQPTLRACYNYVSKYCCRADSVKYTDFTNAGASGSMSRTSRDYNKLLMVLYILEHKMQHLLIHAPNTCIVIFVKQHYLWNIALQPEVGCHNIWANTHCLGSSPLGENHCEAGLLC